MSIDAIIYDVVYDEAGECRLILKPADSRRAPAGQPSIVIVNLKPDLAFLIGEHVWGGAGELMIGDVKFADRIGYTRARIVVR